MTPSANGEAFCYIWQMSNFYLFLCLCNESNFWIHSGGIILQDIML